MSGGSNLGDVHNVRLENQLLDALIDAANVACHLELLPGLVAMPTDWTESEVVRQDSPSVRLRLKPTILEVRTFGPYWSLLS